jgi:NAD-dependent deacetylase
MIKLTFFTGAGVSEESGIPTFRGNDNSLWSKYNVEIVASTFGLKNHFKDVLDFHNDARAFIKDIKPNYCHKLIAELEKQYDITVITTNVDTLHEQAGSTTVIHMHGNLFENCDIDKDNPYISYNSINIGDYHPQTNKQLRPNTVLFGEPLSTDAYTIYNQVVEKSDYLIIIGSSLSVFPVSEITHYNKNVIYINPDLPPTQNYNKWNIIQKSACEGIDDVLKLLKD